MLALLLTAAIGATQSGTPEFRAVASFEAATLTYAPGQSDPPGNHGYDVVLIPIDEGMTATLEDAPVNWAAGVPILISRGAPHAFANRTDHDIRFVEIRTIGDNPAGTDATVASTGATIVGSTVGKYVRATVWRIERGGHVQWPGGIDQVLVLRRSLDVAKLAGATAPVEIALVSDQDHWENTGPDAIELVRISRMAVR